MRVDRFFPCLLVANLMASSLAVAADAKPAVTPTLDARLGAVMADPKTRDAAAKAGKKISFFCANCHGESGNSSKADTPNLAGQNPAYLLEQVNKFSSGQRRNEFMQGLIKAMSDEERISSVVYFSSQEVQPHPVANPALASRGKELFFKACQRCHGEEGRGNEKIPRLAGQQSEYLLLSLKRYRDGTGERTDPSMAANTKNLKDADISALVAYVSGMK